ncbi:V-type ATPase subunit subunit G family protein [Methanocella conradii]|uniref:V-type ATPase subunit subunit G family protein n=1 Tax=Methanocella conradii TaxID=1175444 RepID=UPI00157D2C1B|nr:V-type ATPase subunit subunit G family protein [Methanocella conradii]
MVGQKTLLEQIRDKESELNRRLELAAKEAEGIVLDARRRAESIIRDAELKGSELAAEHYRRGKAAVDGQVEEIKGSEAMKASALRERGEKNLPAAVDLIIKFVAYH